MDQHLNRVRQTQNFFMQQKIEQSFVKNKLNVEHSSVTLPPVLTPFDAPVYQRMTAEREKEILAYAMMDLSRLKKVVDRMETDMEGIYLYEDDNLMTNLVNDMKQRVKDLEVMLFEMPTEEDVSATAQSYHEQLLYLRHQKLEMLEKRMKKST